MSNRKVAFGASICFFVAVALVPLLHGHGETYVGPPGPYVDPPAPPEPAPTPPSTPNGHPTVPGTVSYTHLTLPTNREV